jgi:hypothetical protein
MCVVKHVFVYVCIEGKLEDLVMETNLQVQSSVISMLGLRLVTTPPPDSHHQHMYFEKTSNNIVNDLQMFRQSMMDNHRNTIERFELSCTLRGNFCNGVENMKLHL